MSHLAAWVLLGLIAGSLARLIIPGEEKGGWFVSLTLGIVGAFAGGWGAKIFDLTAPRDPGEWMPSMAAIFSATVGSVIVLLLWKWLRR